MQYVPELLSALKRKVDMVDGAGQYFLTGLQSFSVLKNLAESMAGRVAILTLYPITIHELSGVAKQHWLPTVLNTPDELPDLCKSIIKNNNLWSALWWGGFPGLLNVPDDLVPSILQSYLNTYLERDIRSLESIKDLSDFRRFLAITAALTSQEINDSHMWREIGIVPGTVKR